MKQKKEKPVIQRFIHAVEVAGDKLPHPVVLYMGICVIVLLVAHLLSGTEFRMPGSEDTQAVTSLFNRAGVAYMFTSLYTNFSSMSLVPLIIAMTAAVGIGEYSGMYRSVIVRLFKKVPDRWLVFIFLLVSINGNIMSDAALIILPPMGALLFQSRGKNPLIGVSLSYTGYLAGLSANLLLAGSDATVAAITSDILPTLAITENLNVNVASNWYFMFVSAIMLSIVGTVVTNKILIPVLDSDDSIDLSFNYGNEILDETPEAKRGLIWAGIAATVYIILVLLMVLPQNGFLRNAETGGIIPKSPFLSSIAPLLTLFFLVTGTAYGIGAKTIKNTNDIAKGMTEGVKTIAGVLVIFFVAGQFSAYLTKTNLSAYFAVSGADWLVEHNFTGVALLVAIVLFIALINFFMGSISAKYAMVAPILVPMMAILGFHPAFTQVVYRVGDAITNTINPISAYLPIILGYIQKYKKNAGIGTVVSLQLPYAVTFLVSWTTMLIIWYLLGIPVGPLAPIFIS